MRKNLLFIGLALSMLAVGCNNGPEEEAKKPSSGKKNVTVTANATLPEGLTWAEGDVYLVNGVEAPALGAEANGLQTVALTVSNPDSTSPVIVLGPAALRSGASEVTVGDVQKYVANGYDRSVLVLAGGAAEALPVEETNKNVLAADVNLVCFQGILTLPLTLEEGYTGEAPVAIEQISFTALNNEALCGVYGVSLAKVDGNLVPAIKASEAKSAIDLVCEEPVVLGAEAVNFNIVLPVGLYKGFEVVVNDTEGRKHVFNVESEIAIDANASTVLEAVAYKVIEKAPATLNVTIAESGVVWAEGDAIVCNNELSSVVASSSVGTSTATFELQSVAYPYSVFYPADLYSKAGSVRFSDAQTLMKGAYDRQNIVMVGYSSTTDVEMKNLCGIVRLPFSTKAGENLKVDNIVVESVNGESLAGKYHINYRNYTVTPVSPRSVVTLTPAEGEVIELVPDEETEFMFVVPAGNYAGGLKLTITTNLEVVETVVSPNGVEVRAGEVASLPQYLYEEVKIPAITTAQQFADFVKAVNQGRYDRFMNPETAEFCLGADIDLAGVSVPVGTGAFAGVFNGNGYKLLNWNAEGPIFGSVAAPAVVAEGETVAPAAGVKNLIIDASCQMSASANNGNWGFIAGSATAPIEGCVNNGNIVLAVNLTGALNVGGLVGVVNGADLTSCENHGAVTLNLASCDASESSENPVLVGGIAGRVSGANITSCNNSAAITYSGEANITQTLAVAGIAGSAQATVSQCNNAGNISAIGSGCNLAAVWVAGLTGFQEGMISNCNNSGNLKSEAVAPGEKITIFSPLASKVYPAMGGIVAVAKNAEINTCNNTGEVAAKYSAIGKAGAAGGRYGIAGIVGNPWGTVKNCKNTGKIDVQFKTADGKVESSKNHIPCVGGIAGADYYSTSQSDANVEDCVNEGYIYYHNDCTKSNTTCAGIVGWPGAEGKTTSVTRNCVNKGNIDIYGVGKGRIGTIHGGAGSMIGCTNYGNLTIYGNDSSSCFGGLAGYSGANNKLENCAAYGNVHAKVKVTSIGGMSGQSAGQVFDWGYDCIINCTVQADVAGTYAAMLVGRCNDKDGKSMVLGSAERPVKVAGKLIRPNEDGTTTTIVMSPETMTKEYMFVDYTTHNMHSLTAVYYAQ